MLYVNKEGRGWVYCLGEETFCGKSTKRRGSLSIVGDTLTFRFRQEVIVTLQCGGAPIEISEDGHPVIAAKQYSAGELGEPGQYQVVVPREYYDDVKAALDKTGKFNCSILPCHRGSPH